MTPAELDALEAALAAYLADQDEDDWCQRLKYGKCSMRKCLVGADGKLPPTPIDRSTASCLRYRLEQAREALRNAAPALIAAARRVEVLRKPPAERPSPEPADADLVEVAAGAAGLIEVTQTEKEKDKADLRRMAGLFDQSASDFAARLGEDNQLTKREWRSAELFRLAAGALDLHWAAQEIEAAAELRGKLAMRDEIVTWLRETAPQWGHEALADAIAAIDPAQVKP